MSCLRFALLALSTSWAGCGGARTDGDVFVDVATEAAGDVRDLDAVDAADDPASDALAEPRDDVREDAADESTDAAFDGLPLDAATDRDRDGIADDEEDRLIRAYMPFRAVHPDDRCARHVIVYRLRRHPREPRLLHAIVDSLFEDDCGAGGHVGDNEVFGMTIDPAVPPPGGILAIRAISHQGTLCEHISDCGRCVGASPCSMGWIGGVEFPAVFYSRDKHGAYMTERVCDGACFLTNYCQLPAATNVATLVNAGEPGAPLVRNLTTAGAITAAAGWTQRSLFDFDPWGMPNFGRAGNVAGDLVDDAFLTPTCRP